MKITKKENSSNYTVLFKEIESLYLKDLFREVIEIKNQNTEIDFLDPSLEEYESLAEVFAVCYIEQNMLRESELIIDNHISYLLQNCKKSVHFKDDIATFFKLKMEVSDNNSLFKRLKILNKYISLGGRDKDLLGDKEKVEGELYKKYVFINKVIYFLVLTVIAISILKIYYLNVSYMTIITTIGVLWYLVNFLFYKKIKFYFLRLVNTISSPR